MFSKTKKGSGFFSKKPTQETIDKIKLYTQIKKKYSKELFLYQSYPSYYLKNIEKDATNKYKTLIDDDKNFTPNELKLLQEFR